MNLQYPALETLLDKQFYEFITAKKLISPGDELKLQSVSAEQLFNLKSQDHSGDGGAVIRAL